MKKIDEQVKIFDLFIFSSDKDRLLSLIEDTAKPDSHPLVIFTPNPEQIVLSVESPEFGKILSQADILLPDGVGLVWASKILAAFRHTRVIPARIAGVDLVGSLLVRAGEKKQKVLIVGGRGYDKINNDQFFGADVHWTLGYQDARNPEMREQTQLEAKIQSLQPDLVFVAFGAPEQEKWIIKHLPLLSKGGVQLVMAVGGSFDVLLGKVPRAPLWIQTLGMEWLFRLVVEPWRWRRQLRLIKFIFLVLNDIILGSNDIEKRKKSGI